MHKLIFTLAIFLSASVMSSCASPVKEAVRGVWLTNVDSDALNSKENIIKTVDFCASHGINSIFVVTWNKGMTTYPSAIMEKFTGVKIDTQLTGRDPLKELIDEAHKKDIKVIAWFEFGFSSSFQLNGGEILELKPEWKSINKDGELVVKNGFEWMNGFLPEVQDFLLSLIMEVVENYDIDGIQGDDRLPAMPSEAGYDEYTVALYKRQHGGKNPPSDHKDEEWLRWRAGLLNKFMERIHKSVKSRDENIIVSMAPSIYPWSVEEYLQDWPTWVENGWVDLIIPQVYRYSIEEYSKSLDEIVKEQMPLEKMNILYPGMLIKVGDYQPSLEFLKAMIEKNRSLGIQGEVYFFYEGLKQYSDYIKSIYNEEIKFPDLTVK